MATNPQPDASGVMAALREASEGLLYMSESDEPFTVVHWPGDGTPLDARKVLRLSGHPPESPVKVMALDDFFKDLTQEQAWYGAEEKADARRYRKLLDVLKSRLTGARVYRIGRVNVDYYLLGQTPEGDWAGVKTSAVET